MARKINEIQDTVPLQKSGGTGLDIFSAGLADGEGRIVDSGGSPVWSWDENGVVSAKGLPRVVHSNATAVACGASGAPQLLMPFTIPGGLLANDGDAVLVRAKFSLAGTDSVLFHAYFDLADLIDADSPSYGSGDVFVEMMFVRTGASTGVAFVKFSGTEPDDDAYVQRVVIPMLSGLSSSWASDIAICPAITCGTASAVTQDFMQVVYEPAPV